MDFIEQWFGVSPDGGSGAIELLYVLAIACAIGCVGVVYRRRVIGLVSQLRERLTRNEGESRLDK
jgi:hypothetical protein